MKVRVYISTLLLTFSVSFVAITPAKAATLGSGVCTSTISGSLVGSSTQSGSYCIVIFTSGTGTWTAPYADVSVQYLVVGGGGSGSRGYCSYWWGSGGGGGEVLTGTTLINSSVTVTVGAGGAGGNTDCTGGPNGNDGSQSVLGSVTARAGGKASGSGRGGNSGNGNLGALGPGGYYGCAAPYNCGAGGGGGNGSAASSMNGGTGAASSLTGTSSYYGAGGAGRDNTTYGTANSCAGYSSSKYAGSPNTGCGGSDSGSSSGAGGSGIVVAKYLYDSTAPTITGPSSATGSTSSISIAENTTVVHTFTANESVTWSKSGTDSSFFSLSSGGVLTISSRDYETPQDSDSNNAYVVIITATDAAANASNQTLTVTITNANEAPSISTNSSATTYSITQAENISSVVTYSGSDVDAETTLSWSISGTDAADFAMNSSSGVLTFASNPDYEAPQDADGNNTYIVIITVSDGSLTDAQTLTVTITNANESASVNAPTVSGTIYKGVSTTITVTIDVTGKVRFFVGGKRISTCKDRVTSGSYPNNTATCTWKPAVTGKQYLTATLTPTDNTFSSSTSARTEVFVLKRATSR